MKLQVSGEEKRLELALLSKRINQSSFEEIKEVLRLVMVKVGLRAQNWPNDIEKLVLIEHIISNFGGNRLDEIKLAFDMAMTGQLNMKTEDIKCYENFSCTYFSIIMNGYRLWSAEVARHIQKQEPPIQKIFTQDELDNSQREDAERQYQLFLSGNKLKGLEFNKSILEKDGLIKEEETVLDFFKRCVENLHPNIYVYQPSNKL